MLEARMGCVPGTDCRAATETNFIPDTTLHYVLLAFAMYELFGLKYFWNGPLVCNTFGMLILYGTKQRFWYRHPAVGYGGRRN